MEPGASASQPFFSIIRRMFYFSFLYQYTAMSPPPNRNTVELWNKSTSDLDLNINGALNVTYFICRSAGRFLLCEIFLGR